MKLVTSLLTIALSLQGASAIPWFSSNTNDVGVLLESRQNGKMTYQQVLAASLAKYPGMQSSDASGKFRYNLKPCNAKCEKKNEVRDDNSGECKPCPKGQKPDKDQEKCIRDGSKEQGKCEDGKILDPAAGGQDANTEKPKCISDDDGKCPEGQTAASRRKGRDVDESTYEPECGVDEDSDFRCDDSNTYDYKTVEDGKIKHSCRSTKKHEDDKKSKYDERVKQSKDSKDKKAGDLNKERRKKNRTGWCFVALAGIGAFNDFADDINALSEDEIEGMYAEFPNDAPDPYGDGSIPNYVVETFYSMVGQISMDGAGPGALIGGIPRIIQGVTSAGKASSAAIKSIRSGSARGPSSAAKKAGGKSGTIKKIFKDERMLDCVYTAATAAAGLKSKRETKDSISFSNGPNVMNIQWWRTADMSKPPPEGVSIMLRYDDDEDKLYNNLITRPGSYYSRNRLTYEACQGSPMDNAIVSLQVSGGCCSFYDGSKCEGDTHLFDMENREHQDLQGDHRGTISSLWCTEKHGCEGRP